VNARLVTLRHPVAADALATLRDRTTPTEAFAAALDRLARILAAAALADLPVASDEVETPVARAKVERIAASSAVLVPVLRAGLGFVPAFRALLPRAQVAMVGVVRDEAARAVPYLERVPRFGPGQHVFVLDPMLATGGSAAVALNSVAEHDAQPELVTLVVAIATPQGIEAVARALPSLRVVVGAVDSGLDEHKYIVPGLGDAGDRLFGDGLPHPASEGVVR
jgi:uracil phosphoribosyltransferase